MKRNLVALVYGTLLGAVLFSVSMAQESAPKSAAGRAPDEIAAIRAGSQVFVDAFNQGDAKAVAALWTEDGEYIDDTQTRSAGRDAIEKVYAGLFAENPKTKIRIDIDSLRLLSDNVAIEDGRALLDPAPPGPSGFSKYTVVHVKVEGKWLMASVRDAWIETTSTYQDLADLEWLIGSWVAEENGSRAESVIGWVADNKFLERRYSIMRFDGTKTSGVQLIGWNPLAGHVQSWDFSPDGGHAVGAWTPQPDGWTATMRGVTGDGTPTMSVNLLRRLDDNAYVWQSVQRMAGDIALPDTDEIVLKRQPATR